jgi:hypothetical protein
MGHDVGMDALGKMKPNGAAARIGVGIIVGITGIPVELEKRTVAGTEGLFK